MSTKQIESGRIVQCAMPTHNRFVDITGKRFSMLLVKRYFGKYIQKDGHYSHFWVCECDCGGESIIQTWNIKGGETVSCGCHGRRMVSIAQTTHGASNTPEFTSWTSMRSRCRSKTDPSFKWYGARGIKVCQRWDESFELFLADMGKRPSMAHTIDRIDSNGDYEPSNCRWATPIQQQRNRRNKTWVMFCGEQVGLAELSEKFGVSIHNLHNRLSLGWDIYEALARPVSRQLRVKRRTKDLPPNQEKKNP